MAASPKLFAKIPGKDFTHNRKHSFETVIQLLLSMGGNSLYNKLLEFCGYDVDTATTSVFVQQREKLLPFAFEFLLGEFTSSLNELKTCNGYRLLAVDGSDLNIAHKLKEAIRESDSGMQADKSKVTFAEWMVEWLEVYAKPAIRESTYREYFKHVHTHIVPAFPKILLKDLRTDMLLEAAGYDLDKATYDGLLRKAEDDSIGISGIFVPSNKAYWLRLAKQYRRNQGGCLNRG